MMNLSLRLIGPVLAAVAVTTTRASAALIATDDFDYPANSSLSGSDGGTGFASGWVASLGATPGSAMNVSTSIAAPPNYPFARIGGDVELKNTSTGSSPVSISVQRTLSTPINFDADSTNYFSLLFRRVDGSNTSVNEAINFLDGKKSDGTRLFGFGGNSTEFINLTLNNTNVFTSPTDTYAVNSPTTPAPKDYLIVGKVVTKSGAAADEIYMSLYEASEAILASESWEYSGNGATAGSVATLGASLPNGADSARIDSLRFGSSYADVTGAPEPTTVALFAAGMTVLAGRRRRQGRSLSSRIVSRAR